MMKRWRAEAAGVCSGEAALSPGRVPEGCLLSCILKEIFSQNKLTQPVIKAPRWQTRPFMCSPLRALPFLLKLSQPSPRLCFFSQLISSTQVAYKTNLPGMISWGTFETAALYIFKYNLRMNTTITVALLSNSAGFVDDNRILMPSLCSSEKISADEGPGQSCELNKLLRTNTSETLRNKKKQNKKHTAEALLWCVAPPLLWCAVAPVSAFCRPLSSHWRPLWRPILCTLRFEKAVNFAQARSGPCHCLGWDFCRPFCGSGHYNGHIVARRVRQNTCQGWSRPITVPVKVGGPLVTHFVPLSFLLYHVFFEEGSL